jgi:hypothetical protein
MIVVFCIGLLAGGLIVHLVLDAGRPEEVVLTPPPEEPVPPQSKADDDTDEELWVEPELEEWSEPGPSGAPEVEPLVLAQGAGPEDTEDMFSKLSEMATLSQTGVVTLADMPEGFAELIQQAQKEQAKTRTTRQLSELQAALDLAPEQLTQVMVLIEKFSAREMQVVDQLLSGEEPDEETLMELDVEKQAEKFDRELSGVLSHEQMARYQEHLEAQRLNLAEIKAQRDLSYLQSLVMLDEQQKDAAYNVFYQRGLATAAREPAGYQIPSMAPGEHEQTTEALRDILDPAQLTRYERNPQRWVPYDGSPASGTTVVFESVELEP